jgi:translocation and assembly module TamB
MNEGFLNWDGDLIPGIDMTYKTDVEPYEIALSLIHSRADMVTPKFSSKPWLDNSDVISVLLIGRPLHASSDGGGEGMSGQDIAVSQGVSHLSKKMGLENMGVDIEDANSKGATVRVGRYLSPKWYVSFAKALGNEDDQELSVEYLIRKNLKLKATQETETPLGIDMEWSLDY